MLNPGWRQPSVSHLTSMDSYGFVEVGSWILKEGVQSGITSELHSLAEERVIYALIVDLMKGLENPLIEKFEPEWNIQK